MIRVFLAGLLILLPTLAFAHVGVGNTNGFAHGFGHPISGIDHILAMVAVGLFAAQLGGRALWLVPLSFVTVMAISSTLGATGVSLPFAEAGIGLSIVALGLAVAFGLDFPVVAATVLVGFLAIFHGHAHGSEMPETASGLAYGIGFLAATALLHLAGIGMRLLIERTGQTYGRFISRASGGGMAIAGVAILNGVL